MSTLAVAVTSDFGLVMTSVVGIAVQCLIIGFIGGGLRGKLFNAEFMERHFGEDHWKAFGEKIGKGGYPDTGNGRYAQCLDYKGWFEFNNRQRAHYNCLEQVATIISLVLVSGISVPVAAGVIGWVYFVGRIAYTFGYISKGPKGRTVGALICDVALVASLVTAIISCVRIYDNSTA